MRVFWEDETTPIYKNYDNNKIIVFVGNLKMFMFNHKEIKFESVFPENVEEKDYFEAVDSDGIIYRHLHGAETKEDLIEWCEVCKKMYKNPKYSYSHMKINIEHIAFNWAKSRMKDEETGHSYLAPKMKEICSDNKELYEAFSSTYFNGYFFNNCDPNKVYKNVYSYDFKSNHSAIMYYEKFPKNFIKTNPLDFNDMKKKKLHFYGLFTFQLNKRVKYLEQFGARYNPMLNQVTGYFNDIDYEFFNELCGIKHVSCGKLWKVELDDLSLETKVCIARLFCLKERISKGKTRDFVKAALEKIYGETVKRRTYEDITWEELRAKKRRTYEYSTGVWTVSYCRLKLLKIQKAIGDDAIYGDIDSIKFCNAKHKRVIDEINKKIPKDFPLGLLGFEYLAKEFKALSQKTYCAATEDGLEIRCAGANREIVQNYFESLEEPVKNFTRDFPADIKPYKTVTIENDKMVYKWISSADTKMTFTI